MKKNTIKRRDFIKLLAGSSLAGGIGQLSFLSKAHAAAPAFSDYKAMVCIFLHGGNDSFNMMIPNAGEAGRSHSDYASIRGNLTVANTDLGLSSISTTNTDLNNGILGLADGNPYHVDGNQETAYLKGIYDLNSKGIPLGVNAVMPELAQLITDNKASIISNIGTLVEPVTRQQIHEQSAELPVFLFAHDHQQRALQTGQANNLNDIGWAGKIADQWRGINNNSPMGLNISYAGNDRMLIGNNTTPLVMKPGTPPRFTGMVANSTSKADQDRRAFFKALTGIENSSESGNVSFDQTKTFTSDDPFINLYASKLKKSFDTFDNLYTTWNDNQLSYTTTGSYGEALFDIPDSSTLGFNKNLNGSLIRQLETVAKMIHLGASGTLESSNYNRQIFYVNLGAFDTHSDQAINHPRLLRELSLALWKFQNALEELGHANKVTTFTMSDFGRTMSNNGDGTDHAWGAFHLVMGGDGQNTSNTHKGGQLIGELPDIRLGSEDDFSDKGRIIPKLSQDQLNATLCNWLGVEDTDIARIFPNLANFENISGDISSAYLDDLFVS